MSDEYLLFDPGDPGAAQTWTVPARVYAIRLYVQGGGLWNPLDEVGMHGNHGVQIATVPVAPGDDLSFLFGSAPEDQTGGYGGGGAGGGGVLFVGDRGYGAGGRTQVLRNGDLWVVAGGEGGSVNGANTWPPNEVITVDSGVPGADDEPRVAQAAPVFDPPAVVDSFTPGNTGGITDGGDGITDGALTGSSGGGGGYGGGSGGGWYAWHDDMGARVSAQVGKSGGHLVPGDAILGPMPWEGSAWSIAPDNGGHGWALIQWSPGGGGWNTGRIAW